MAFINDWLVVNQLKSAGNSWLTFDRWLVVPAMHLNLTGQLQASQTYSRSRQKVLCTNSVFISKADDKLNRTIVQNVPLWVTSWTHVATTSGMLVPSRLQ